MKMIRLMIGLMIVCLLGGGVLCPSVHAELNVSNDPLMKLLPSVENGWYYDFNRSELLNATGAKILGYKGIELSANWATGVGDNERSENVVMATLGYRLGTLEKFGVEYPLLNIIDIKPCVFYGYNVDIKEAVYGVGATIVQVKF